jgi:hypothetical protein
VSVVRVALALNNPIITPLTFTRFMHSNSVAWQGKLCG